DRADAHDQWFDFVAIPERKQIGHWQPLTVPANALPLMAEINRRHLEAFAADVFPDIHLRPVAERERAHVFAGIDAGVVKIPAFRPLVFRVPLAEAVAEAEEALLRAGLFLVAARAADQAIEPELLDRREQRGDLEPVAADLAGRRH